MWGGPEVCTSDSSCEFFAFHFGSSYSSTCFRELALLLKLEIQLPRQFHLFANDFEDEKHMIFFFQSTMAVTNFDWEWTPESNPACPFIGI